MEAQVYVVSNIARLERIQGNARRIHEQILITCQSRIACRHLHYSRKNQPFLMIVDRLEIHAYSCSRATSPAFSKTMAAACLAADLFSGWRSAFLRDFAEGTASN